ncbi:hydrolase [Ascochyta rabiei]|uniref:Hydrolase n=1 Tax=Didymella rabiei TaxID=5454 RepID=A0A163AGR9_DIDRA|nr:hydrolase [Ascochyta rabiei]
MGVCFEANYYFTILKRKGYWDANVTKIGEIAEGHGTVGATALDIYGNLAATDSTGGTMFKSVDRVRDTAILGAGIYADDKVAIVWYVPSSIT